MLVIRRQQVRALASDALAAFEDEAARFVERRFGAYAAALGSSAVRAAVQHGLRRAEERGLASDDDLRLHLELAFLLGSGFDRDRLLPWASRILDDPERGDPGERLRRVYGEAMGHLCETAGHDARLLLAALPRLAHHSWEAPGEGRSLDATLDATLRELYPERLPALAREGLLSVLVEQARRTAAAHGIVDDAGIVLVAILQLLLGSDVLDDPQFPWARQALQQPADSAGKTAALQREARAFLARLLAGLTAGRA
jgi:hypothetical protein